MHDLNIFYEKLHNDGVYERFLNNIQGFNVNLINITETIEEDYVANINNLFTDTEDTAFNMSAKLYYQVMPTIVNNSEVITVYRNPNVGLLSLINNNYQCQYDNNHTTFINNSSQKPFMEIHHLIPIKFISEFWQNYNVNIDCVENVVTLCTNCHRAVHYGNDLIRKEILSQLYKLKKDELSKLNINLSLQELLSMYE